MTKRQKAHAIRLLKNDCKLKGKYIDDSGLTCAIGCLALAAGVRKKTLESVNYTGISESFVEYPALKRIVEAIERKFGLNQYQQYYIQAANDGQDYRDVRVDEVVKVVKGVRVRRSK
jgi:hypothetical protein